MEIEYDKYPDAKRIKLRFIILKLKNECENKYESFYYNVVNNENFSYDHDIFDWVKLKKGFQELLEYYDNGGKLNESFLLSLDNKKLKNIKATERLLKLTKIT